LESFERTPVQKKLPSPLKQTVSNEGRSQPTNQSEPSDSPTGKASTQTSIETEGAKDVSKTDEVPSTTNKETPIPETPLKESVSNHSSDVKTDKTTPKSKTLPANKQATPAGHEGKSEAMAHPSSMSKPDEKKQAQPATSNKDKTSEAQEKTAATKDMSSLQDNRIPNTTANISDKEIHYIGDKGTCSDPSTQDPSQPVVNSPTDSDDFVIVDLVDGPVEVPVSEFFPVSHVTLNHDDWSLCVANTGLCVLVYSFHPIMTSSIPIKVCTVYVI